MHTVTFIPHEETTPAPLECIAEMGGVAEKVWVTDWHTVLQEALEDERWADALDAAMRMTACLAAMVDPADDSLYFCRRQP